MCDRNRPTVYRVVTFHAITACCAQHAEDTAAQAYPGAAVVDEATAPIATADGHPIEAPELCGHTHIGAPALYYDGESFKTEVVVG